MFNVPLPYFTNEKESQKKKTIGKTKQNTHGYAKIAPIREEYTKGLIFAWLFKSLFKEFGAG